jgi:hypothetical protein
MPGSLVYEYDAAVEVALFAREPLIDPVRNDVSDTAEIVRHRQIELAVELDFADHVPKPELGHDAAVRLAVDTPGHQCLDGAPFRKARLPIEIDPLGQCDLIDRCEQAAPP